MEDAMETRKIQQKESVYRKLYSSILQEHQGVLQRQQDDAATSSVFDDEQQSLNRIFHTEVKNLLIGVGVTASVMAMLRLGSTYGLSTVFGEAKSKALKDARIEAKRRGTEGFQKAAAFFVEGMFSLWAGFRCYDYASHRSEASWEAVSEIPLCKGRSRISEALCPQWIQVTNTQIPREFWKAHAEGKLRDERTWTAIHNFSVNCERRLAVEAKVRKELSLPDGEPVVLPQRVGTSPVLHCDSK